MKRLLVLLITTALITSCSVMKRHYMGGFYVYKKSKTNSISLPSRTDPVHLHVAEIVSIPREIKDESILTSKTEFPEIKNHFINYTDPCGDIITLKNGEDLKCKVLEVGVNEIKYKLCDNMDGPIRIVSRKDVFSIKYANGIKEVIKDAQQEQKPQSYSGNDKRMHWGAVAGFILSLVGVSVLGIIFSLIGVTAIRKHPEKYEGGLLATIGVFLGVVGLLIIAAILLGAI